MNDHKSGDLVGHYRILSLLGEGGMGKVYLAEDTRLDRKVSLKFISNSLVSDQEQLRRFEHEARAASALNHPNIITIHEIGDDGDRKFISAEFIDGQNLRERLRSPLDLDDSLEIASQVASALVAAHRSNIIHRDLKPENIMIRKDDGLVKVLDFGLAKISPNKARDRFVDPECATIPVANTAPGVVMGTVAYMSPEQARGERVDERTDIWSLGVVLYEMMAGASPFFALSSSEIIAAILSKQPTPPLARYAPTVPERLEEIVEKTLNKNRDERYQTAKDLLLDLRRLQKTLDLNKGGDSRTSKGPVISTPERRGSEALHSVPSKVRGVSSAEYIFNQINNHRVAALFVLAIFIALTATVLWFSKRPKPAGFIPEIKSLAVLPLNNLSGDPSQEYFADGMTEALISNLSQIRALRVISRVSAMRFKGTTKSIPDIAKELDVDAVIEGSVQRSGSKVLVTARLVPAATDSPLWSQQYDRDLSDVLKLQSEIAGAITDEIRIQVTSNERARLAAARTVNPQAHEAYLLGRFHLSKKNEEDLRQAIEHFQQAIQIEPDYAAAYSGLSEAWQESGIWGGKTFNEVQSPARAAALKAIELDDQLPDAHRMLAQIDYIFDWNWAAAEQEFMRALDLDPGSAHVRQTYATFLMALGHHEKAIAQMTQAALLDPLSSDIQSNFGRVLYRARKYDEAISHFKRSLELDPRNYSAYIRWGDVYVLRGQYDEALEMFAKAGQLRNEGMHSTRTARVYALMGKRDEARNLLKGSKAGAFDTAGVYAALGDLDNAFKVLEEAVKERSSLLVFVKEDPTFDNLRTDPRWERLCRQMNFPQRVAAG